MHDSIRFALLNKYSTPLFRYGEKVWCEYRDVECEIGGLSDGRIPWPTAVRQGKYPIIVYGTLVDAIRTESAIAVAYWWGVSKVTVTNWKRSLSVPRTTAGGYLLYVNYYPEKQPGEFVDKSAIGKIGGAVRGEQLRGRPALPQVAEALRHAASQPKSEEWKRKAAECGRLHTPKGSHIHPDQRPWTEAERVRLGTTTDRDVALFVGRTINAVRSERRRLGIPPFKKKDNEKTEGRLDCIVQLPTCPNSTERSGESPEAP